MSTIQYTRLYCSSLLGARYFQTYRWMFTSHWRSHLGYKIFWYNHWLWHIWRITPPIHEAVHNSCRQPLSYIKIIFLYAISSAVAWILFFLLTHSIWSCIFNSSVTPHCSAICSTSISTFSLASLSTWFRCSVSFPVSTYYQAHYNKLFFRF